MTNDAPENTYNYETDTSAESLTQKREQPCRIILARHGQTEWNQEMRFQGRTDTPLTEAGKSQAKSLAKRLSRWGFEIVYSSPLERALFTAREIADTKNLEPVILPQLEEINFGIWEGMSIKGIQEANHEFFSRWRADPFFNPPDKAEDWQQLSERLSEAMRIILNANHKNIVVVSHGGIMRALYGVFLGLNPHNVWNMDVSNCAMSGIEMRNGRACMVFSNDDLHVRAGSFGENLPIWGEM